MSLLSELNRRNVLRAGIAYLAAGRQWPAAHRCGYERAREAASKALEGDSKNASAHEILGWMSSRYDRDLTSAAQHLERAMALEPTNPAILGNAAILAQNLGRLQEAIKLIEYVNVRDPVNPVGHANLGWRLISLPMVYHALGRVEESEAALDSLSHAH